MVILLVTALKTAKKPNYSSKASSDASTSMAQLRHHQDNLPTDNQKLTASGRKIKKVYRETIGKPTQYTEIEQKMLPKWAE